MGEIFYEDILETFLFCFFVSMGIIQIAAARRGWHGLSLYGGRIRANLNRALGAALVILGYAWYFSDPLHRNVRNIEALMSLVCLVLGIAAAAAATALLASLTESLRRLARGSGRGKSLATEVMEFPEGKAVLSGPWGERGKNLVVLAEPGKGSEALLRSLHAFLPAPGGVLSLHPRSGLGEERDGAWAGEEEMMRMLARLERERGLDTGGENFLGLGWCANAALRLRGRLEEAYVPRKLLALAPVVPEREGDFAGDSLLSNTPADIIFSLLRNRPWDPRAARRAVAAWLPAFLICAALATAVTVAFGVRWKFISGPAAGLLLSLWVIYFPLARGKRGGRGAEALLVNRAHAGEDARASTPALVVLSWEEAAAAGDEGARLAGMPEGELWRDKLRGKFLLGGGTADRIAALIWDGIEEDGRSESVPPKPDGGSGSTSAEG